MRRGKVDCSFLRRQYPTARCYPSVIFAKADCTGNQCTYGGGWALAVTSSTLDMLLYVTSFVEFNYTFLCSYMGLMEQMQCHVW